MWSLRNRERTTEAKRKVKKKEYEEKKREGGGEGRVGVSPPVGSSSESEEDPFVFSTERKGQQ